MATRRQIARLSLRGLLCAVAVSAGLGACAVFPGDDGCQYQSAILSAGQRSVGGGTLICDPNLTDSAEQILHPDDYVLRNRMW